MPAVLGDVEAGVVTQIDRGVSEVVSEPGTVGGLFASAVAIGVQPPGFLGLAQAVDEDRQLRQSPRGRQPRATSRRGATSARARRTAIWIANGLSWSDKLVSQGGVKYGQGQIAPGRDPGRKCSTPPRHRQVRWRPCRRPGPPLGSRRRRRWRCRRGRLGQGGSLERSARTPWRQTARCTCSTCETVSASVRVARRPAARISSGFIVPPNESGHCQCATRASGTQRVKCIHRCRCARSALRRALRTADASFHGELAGRRRSSSSRSRTQSLSAPIKTGYTKRRVSALKGAG